MRSSSNISVATAAPNSSCWRSGHIKYCSHWVAHVCGATGTPATLVSKQHPPLSKQEARQPLPQPVGNCRANSRQWGAAAVMGHPSNKQCCRR